MRGPACVRALCTMVYLRRWKKSLAASWWSKTNVGQVTDLLFGKPGKSWEVSGVESLSVSLKVGSAGGP